MLALAHPTEARTIDRTGVDRNISSLPRTTPSSSSSRTSSSRVAHWKPQASTTTAVFQPSSSYCPRRSVSASSVVTKDSSPVRNHAVQSSQAISESSAATSKDPPPDNPPRAGSPIPPPQINVPASASYFDVHNYPSTDLLRLLASLLTQIASTNDVISGSDLASHTLASLSHNDVSEDASCSPIWRSLTSASRSSLSNPASALTFHARNIPTIALESYLLRILKYCPTTNEVFLALLVYFDRMSRLASEATGRTFVIDSYNVHRLVIAGVTVASKFFSDVFYTNSRYAKVGGLPQAELNQLELQFLLLNDFRLVISPEEMQRYAEQLILFSQSQPPEPPSVLRPVTPSRSQQSQTRSSPTTVSGPARAMGAIDVYGGSVAPDRTPSMRAVRTRDDDAASIVSTETDTETETEGGYTTDDEPTIRPPNSSSSICGDAEECESAGEFRAATVEQGDECRQNGVEDKERERGDITPELKARRLVREISEDIGMASP
ncbi:cyclin-domain-containing protein [Suillus subalutaceus]|uniref:cyclin-domain-containing protein n=1 Tax=Suillus subalutaceus TaxID=48586 RepID=UPI001B87D746|nr:cyclin-domain-containing protein [Suillus subalutaceus]KAG1859020.1 cyclin-domain-containing protein [Suillus subalutaceus]